MRFTVDMRRLRVVQRDAQMSRRQLCAEFFGPFHRDDPRLREQLIHADGLEIMRTDAPRVDVCKRSRFTAMIHAQGECWTRHCRVIGAHAACDAAHQRGLAGAQITRQEKRDRAGVRVDAAQEIT